MGDHLIILDFPNTYRATCSFCKILGNGETADYRKQQSHQHEKHS